jgi:hypothetical protein
MTSQRWSTLVSGLVFALVLTTGDSTRAQWGYPGTSGFAAAGQFGLGYGAVPGISPVGYGPYGAGDFFGTSNFIGFPQPGYAESIGQWPLTTTSFQTVSETVSLVPAWSGSPHRVHRRNRAQPSVPRAAIRRGRKLGRD